MENLYVQLFSVSGLRFHCRVLGQRECSYNFILSGFGMYGTARGGGAQNRCIYPVSMGLRLAICFLYRLVSKCCL